MKQSFQPTEYVIVRAGTKSVWERGHFALLHLSPAWLFVMRQRLAVTAPFKVDPCFYCNTYWDEPLGYFVSKPESEIDRILNQLARDCDSWAFVTVDDPNEPALLDVPESKLDLRRLTIDSDGYASYSGFCLQSRAEYATQWFSLKQILKIRG